MGKKLFSAKTTKKMAMLSKLPIDPKEQTYFTRQFNQTLKTVDQLSELDTKNTPDTYHVTGLSNITRDDVVEKKSMLSQKEALSNAKQTHKGYFVVKAIFDEE